MDELENCFPASNAVEDTFQAVETARMIDAFLETLDKKRRILFVRRYWYSDSITDIAHLFQISNHAVSVRLARIRAKLKKYLIEKGVSI